ncbi:MAG: zinc ABC transporter substrate-binding protein [Verrucomicrobiales bacterium]|nr:zinc ABC transporter substrate-binding protein [Verrucomicrobiales bacterium]
MNISLRRIWRCWAAASRVAMGVLAVMLWSCSQSSEPGTEGKAGRLKVVATTTMVGDMVRAVAGDRVELQTLMGPGVDPHLYKPTADDVTHLRNADVIFYSGLMLEGRMADLFERMGEGGKRVFAVTDAISDGEKLKPAELAEHWDPHVWFDPVVWSQCIAVVVEALTDADAGGGEIFKQNGEAVKGSYLAAHEWALKRVAELPKQKRVLVTSHDAFNYFGRAYGFEVVAVQGISTVSEAGLADIAKMVDFIKQREVKAIFVESSVSRAAIERISKDSGAKIGGELFSDAMGAEGELFDVGEGEQVDVGTYEGMLKRNVFLVVEALK